MEQEIFSWLASDNGLFVHAAVFVLLIWGGFGLPLPEDIPIMLAGVAASKGIVSLEAIFLTCYVGVLLADQAVFLIGYFFGKRLLSAGTKSRIFPTLTKQRVNEVRESLRKRRLLYIFIGRHLFPVRSVTFLAAGSLRMPFLEFLVSDALAALISVSLVLGLGYYLGGKLSPELIEHFVHKAHYYIAAIVIISLALYLLKKCFRKERKLIESAQDTSNDNQTPVGEKLVSQQSK